MSNEADNIKDKNHFDKTFYFIAVGMFIAFGYIFLITFFNIPPKNERLVDIILGVMLGTIITGGWNFYTSSTAGSQKKDDTIAAQNTTIQSQSKNA